jgi:hypothetical protein
VWTARVAGTLTNATFGATLSKTGFDLSLTVIAFANAAGVGASAGASVLHSAPTVSLTTTGPGSVVYGVGIDWDNAVAHVPVAGQAIAHQWVDSASGDTMWSQGTQAPVAASGATVALADSAPTTDRFNLAAVEITAATGPPPTTTTTTVPVTTTTVAPTTTTTTVAPTTTTTVPPTTTTTTTVPQTTTTTTTTTTDHHHHDVPTTTTTTTTVPPTTTTTTTTTTVPPTTTTTVPASGGPVISGLAVSNITTTGATVSWNTDTAAIGQVEYGTSVSYGTTTAPDAVAATVHSQTLAGLTPLTVYHFRARSTNAGGLTVTTDQTFTTQAAPVGAHVDGQVSIDGKTTVAAPALTTGIRDDLIVAMVASDGPTAGGQTATVSGGGLTWTRVGAQAVQPGDVEVWQARASGFLTNAVVSATLAKTGYDVSLSVVAFSNAAGVGASAGASAKPGAPTVSLVTTAAGSLVLRHRQRLGPLGGAHAGGGPGARAPVARRGEWRHLVGPGHDERQPELGCDRRARRLGADERSLQHRGGRDHLGERRHHVAGHRPGAGDLPARVRPRRALRVPRRAVDLDGTARQARPRSDRVTGFGAATLESR